MTTIVTRAGKGAALSWNEADANWTNLNNSKLEQDGSIPLAGPLTFTSGTTSRILGNMSSADLSTRLFFQNDFAGIGETAIGVLPPSGSTISVFYGCDGTDPNNCGITSFGINGTAGYGFINTFSIGTGTVRPIYLCVNSTPKLQVNTSGEVVINQKAYIGGVTAPGVVNTTLHLWGTVGQNGQTAYTTDIPISQGTLYNIISYANTPSGAQQIAGAISFKSDEAWSNTANGSYIQFRAISNTTTTLTDVVRMWGNGKVSINATGRTSGDESLQVNGNISINSNILLRSYTSFLNGAGSSTATLTNAPVAGNPTKWVQINDAGTLRYIPSW